MVVTQKHIHMRKKAYGETDAGKLAERWRKIQAHVDIYRIRQNMFHLRCSVDLRDAVFLHKIVSRPFALR